MKIFFLINLLILLPAVAFAQFSLKIGVSQGANDLIIQEGGTFGWIANLESDEPYSRTFPFPFDETFFNLFNTSYYKPNISISEIVGYDSAVKQSTGLLFGYEIEYVSFSQDTFNHHNVWQGNKDHRLKLGNTLSFSDISTGIVPYLRWNLGAGRYVQYGLALRYNFISLNGDYYHTLDCVDTEGNLNESELKNFVLTNCELVNVDITKNGIFTYGLNVQFGSYYSNFFIQYFSRWVDLLQENYTYSLEEKNLILGYSWVFVKR